MSDYTCVKLPKSKYEALCLMYAYELMGSKYIYFTDESGLNTFVGVKAYFNMPSERYIEAVKPMLPDYVYRNSTLDTFNDLWYGTINHDGVCSVMEDIIGNVSDLEKRTFKLQYDIDFKTRILSRREAGEYADPCCLENAEQLERDAQRIKSKVFGVKPEKSSEEISDEFAELSKDPVFNGDLQRKEVRSVNESVQQDWDDEDEFRSYLDNLEG